MSHVPLFSLSGRTGKPVKYQQLTFYACEGLIICIDDRDTEEGRGDFSTITPKDLEDRIEILGAADTRIRDSLTNVERQERGDRIRKLQELKDVVREAKGMGDPSDPAVQAFWRLHQPGSKSRVTLRQSLRDRGHPDMGTMPQGPFTGRTAEADGVLALSADSAKLLIHQPPQRKSRSGLILS